MKHQIQRFLREEDGITALEYGILASIVVAAIVLIFGDRLTTLFKSIFTSLDGSVGELGGD